MVMGYHTARTRGLILKKVLFLLVEHRIMSMQVIPKTVVLMSALWNAWFINSILLKNWSLDLCLVRIGKILP